MPAARVFVPAAFAGLLAEMPPASAPVNDRAAWLTSTVDTLRSAIPGTHGLTALTLLPTFDKARHAAADELAAATAA